MHFFETRMASDVAVMQLHVLVSLAQILAEAVVHGEHAVDICSIAAD